MRMMMPVRDENDDVREFYSLVEGEITASIRIPKFKTRKCHESLGWLLAVEEDGNMCLLDPFSNVEILLPHQRTFPEYDDYKLPEYIFVSKMVLSARPSETPDFIVMIICGNHRHLAFWRPGDESWNRIEMRYGAYTDVMYHGGHFYAIGFAGLAWVFTLGGDNPPKSKIVARRLMDTTKNPPNRELLDERNFYILKTSESLFMISRTAPAWSEEEDRYTYRTSKFQIFEVDMIKGTWTEINNIGSMAIFVGHNGTFVVDTYKFCGKIKGNHIYFSDDGWESYHFHEKIGGGKDMGVYSMETGTILSFYSREEVLLSKVCLSIWISPYF